MRIKEQLRFLEERRSACLHPHGNHCCWTTHWGVLGYLVQEGWSCRKTGAQQPSFCSDPRWHHRLRELPEAPWESAPQRWAAPGHRLSWPGEKTRKLGWGFWTHCFSPCPAQSVREDKGSHSNCSTKRSFTGSQMKQESTCRCKKISLCGFARWQLLTHRNSDWVTHRHSFQTIPAGQASVTLGPWLSWETFCERWRENSAHC